MNNKSLLLVDDEPNVLKSLCRELSPSDYSLFTASSAAEGLEIIKKTWYRRCGIRHADARHEPFSKLLKKFQGIRCASC